MDITVCILGILVLLVPVFGGCCLYCSLKEFLIQRIEINAACRKCEGKPSDLYNVAMEYYVNGKQILSEKIFDNCQVPLFLKTGGSAIVYVNPGKPDEFRLKPYQDVHGIIAGLVLLIIGLTVFLPLGIVMVKTGLGV